jgi:TrmH family RNA methyltransferase
LKPFCFVSNLTSKEDLLLYSKYTIEITHEIYQKLAYRDSTEGVNCNCKCKFIKLWFKIKFENPLILVVESRKPGNLGEAAQLKNAQRQSYFVTVGLF